jgi:hypothetical protein
MLLLLGNYLKITKSIILNIKQRFITLEKRKINDLAYGKMDIVFFCKNDSKYIIELCG